jgi:hypothetical protein
MALRQTTTEFKQGFLAEELVMTDQPRPHAYYETNRPWQNFHQNLCFRPERYYDLWNLWEDSSSPQTRKWQAGLSALQQIIRDAEKSNRQVRALGGGWSLSDAVKTPGFLLNTRPLNIIEIGVRREHCSPEFLAKDRHPERLVFAQCGASIAELSQELENNGLSLPTSGASNGQTICGAMSTGTHGAALAVGSVQDYIVGVHLVSAKGQQFWIQPNTSPVVNEDFCNILVQDMGADITLVQDDDYFNAVRVSFGSFGIIHAVLIQAEPIFLLERHVCPYHFTHVLPVLQDLENMSLLKLKTIHGRQRDDPFHFEVLINPFAFKPDGDGIKEREREKGAYVRYMYKVFPADLGIREHAQGELTLSNDVFGLLGALSTVAFPLLPIPYKALLESQLKPDNGVDRKGTILTHGGTFSSTQIPGHSLSTELGFALSDVPKAVSIIVREFLKYPFLGTISLRYVKGSSAFLALTKYNPTCTIEIPAIGCAHSRSQEGYKRIWKALEEKGIEYTFHWGQCQQWGPSPSASRQRLQKVFGDRLNSWLKARSFFLSTHEARHTFSNPLLKSCGLDD